MLEARKEVGRGIVATVLVQNGTLNVGDVFVSGATWGRVRSMSDDRGERIQEAGPVDAGRGHRLQRPAGRRRPVPGGRGRGARRAASPSSASRRSAAARLAPAPGRGSRSSSSSAASRRARSRSWPVVLKADVQGSLEVLRDALGKAEHGEGQGLRSSTPASAPSRPTTCCSPRPPRRSSSASTSAPSAAPPTSPRRKGSTSACTPSSTS